jgi:hypothetical protein
MTLSEEHSGSTIQNRNQPANLKMLRTIAVQEVTEELRKLFLHDYKYIGDSVEVEMS